MGASYPGASAKVVEEAVTAIIEREMNGAPGLLYTTASSDSTGWASINLVFKQGTNPDLAAVEVQNRLKAVEPRLPEAVRRDGVRVEKAADNIQLVVSLKSDGRLDDMQLGELAASNVLQALRRVDGVGKVQLWGAEAAMRIWPDPAKLTAMSLTPGDIVNAARAQRPRHHRRPGQPGRAGQRAAERQHRRHRNAADARAVRQHPLRAQLTAPRCA